MVFNEWFDDLVMILHPYQSVCQCLEIQNLKLYF